MIESNQLLEEARHEILQLRKRNEILQAKVEVMDLFSVMLHTQPCYPPQAASVDVAWQIEKFLESNKQPVAETAKPVTDIF